MGTPLLFSPQITGKHKIRLYGIDCPEKNQAYGTRAKQFISELIFGKEVTVYPKTIDKYGRTIGEVFSGGRNINSDLPKYGGTPCKRCGGRCR
jgi:micrococcal nuclease